MSFKYIAKSKLPTPWGEFTIHGFENDQHSEEFVVASLGEIENINPVLARVHSECLTGDTLFSLRCDCGAQLEASFKAIADEGKGLILYLPQEGRGIGLMNKIRAYALQDQGADTVEANEQLGFEADLREYSVCKEILDHFGIQKVRLMTNNPKKMAELEKIGIEVTERVPLETGRNPHNENYLKTKAGKLGHLIKSK